MKLISQNDSFGCSFHSSGQAVGPERLKMKGDRAQGGAGSVQPSDLTVALGGCAGYSDQAVPRQPRVSSSASLLCAHVDLLLLLSTPSLFTLVGHGPLGVFPCT